MNCMKISNIEKDNDLISLCINLYYNILKKSYYINILKKILRSIKYFGSRYFYFISFKKKNVKKLNYKRIIKYKSQIFLLYIVI